MAGNDDEGLVTFLKANTPLNNTERERCQCPAWIQAFFSTEQYLDFFPFLNESTFIPTSLRSLDWKRLFLKNWSPSAESHMFSLADECCLLGWADVGDIQLMEHRTPHPFFWGLFRHQLAEPFSNTCYCLPGAE